MCFTYSDSYVSRTEAKITISIKRSVYEITMDSSFRYFSFGKSG